MCLSSNDRIIISIGYKTLNGECEMLVSKLLTLFRCLGGMEVVKIQRDIKIEKNRM